MKKLMIAAAIVCAAAFVHAATYSWEAINTSFYDNVSGTDLSTPIYVFDSHADGTSVAAVQAALAAGTFAILDSALGNDVLDGGMINFLSGEADTPTGISAYAVGDAPNQKYYMDLYAVVFDGETIDKSKNFAITTIDPVELNDGIKGGSPAGFDFGYVEYQSSDWNAINVPEPTSGLLLLLGVAGLALRRRRA